MLPAQAQTVVPVHAGPPPPHQAGEPVFPISNKTLPEFFGDIRSVGINLELPFSDGFDFSHMTPNSLRDWAKSAIDRKFDIVFPEVLDRFPNLEYAFAVVRAHGRSNQEQKNGIEQTLDKKKWTDVGMMLGMGTSMGKAEFRQVENQARLWLMKERIKRGITLNEIDFDLYVQTNIEWEI